MRTEWPDGTQSRVEFTPWVERRYDRNDTVLGSTWYSERIGLGSGDPELRAAMLTEAHADTPSVAHMDALGRPFLHVEHDRDEEENDVFGQTRLVLDVVGNVLEVTDARENLAEARTHGMLRQVLRVTSEDAGERRVLRDVVGAPCRAWNSRGFVTEVEYDEARRPLRTVVTRPDTSTFTAVRMVYGEGVTSAEDSNLRGRVFRVYDGAGLVQSNAFDFAGNLLSQTRRLTVAYDETPSWSDLDGLTDIGDLDTATATLLETETFVTTATFDALGRPVTQTTPDASVTQLGYDDGGKLYSVAANVRGAVTATDFVTSIEYDARGQRQRIEYGNDTRTTYEHDPRTFRLRRLHTTNTAETIEHQDLRYTYDPVGNITEIRDLAQPVVFTSNASISADQRFTYDALYRLIQAEGREHGSQGQPISDDFTPRAAPDDPTGLRAYTEGYAYDLVGNILEVQHQAPSGNWTRRYQYAPDGNRLLATSAPGDGPGVYSHEYEYDAHGSMTAMPHLAEIAWDHADRMQSADLGGGGTVWFLYDSAGNRVRKIRVNLAGTLTYERIYVGGYEVYRERVSGDLELERQTLHVADYTGRICLVETKTVEDGDPVTTPANTSRYQYGNHLGSVGMELDETGQLISYEELHPYGTTAYRAANSAVDVSPSRYRYTGKERDEETGLGHHGARYYASWLARWTAADPIGLGDGVNRFAYTRANPIRLDDPTGTFARGPTEAKIEVHRFDPVKVTRGEDNRVGFARALHQTFGDRGLTLAEANQLARGGAIRRGDEEFRFEQLPARREFERTQKYTPTIATEDFTKLGEILGAEVTAEPTDRAFVGAAKGPSSPFTRELERWAAGLEKVDLAMSIGGVGMAARGLFLNVLRQRAQQQALREVVGGTGSSAGRSSRKRPLSVLPQRGESRSG